MKSQYVVNISCNHASIQNAHFYTSKNDLSEVSAGQTDQQHSNLSQTRQYVPIFPPA